MEDGAIVLIIQSPVPMLLVIICGEMSLLELCAVHVSYFG